MCTTYVTHARNLEANLYVHAIHIGKKTNTNTHKVNFQSCTDPPLDPNYVHSHRCCIQYRSGKLCTYLDIDFLCSYVAHSIQLFAQLHIPVFYPEGLVPHPKLRDRQLLSSINIYVQFFPSLHTLLAPTSPVSHTMYVSLFPACSLFDYDDYLRILLLCCKGRDRHLHDVHSALALTRSGSWEHADMRDLADAHLYSCRPPCLAWGARWKIHRTGIAGQKSSTLHATVRGTLYKAGFQAGFLNSTNNLWSQAVRISEVSLYPQSVPLLYYISTSDTARDRGRNTLHLIKAIGGELA